MLDERFPYHVVDFNHTVAQCRNYQDYLWDGYMRKIKRANGTDIGKFVRSGTATKTCSDYFFDCRCPACEEIEEKARQAQRQTSQTWWYRVYDFFQQFYADANMKRDRAEN